MSDVGDGFGAGIHLDVIGIAGKLEASLTDGLSTEEHVENELDGAKHQPL